jgi:hypothetical protein
MNKRIQALVYKADEVEILPDEDFCDTDFLADMDPRRVKIFAELLHRQVIASILITDVVMEAKGQVPTSEDYIQAINKDFGVEE